MLLHLSTWEEVEAYLDRSTGIIVPVGSTEQHGPTGLIGTDTICPETIARDVGQASDALIGPAIPFGPAQFNLAFPGSITTRPTTLIALAMDYVNSLARQGFQRFYFLNGHGGNVAPMRAAFQEIYTATSMAPGGNRPPVRCRLRSWWDLPTVDRLRRDLYGDAEGMHATPSEVAVTQHVHPHLIHRRDMAKPEKLSAAFLRDRAGDDHYDAEHHRRRFPDGRVGSDPSLATPEDGKQLFEAAVKDAITDYQAFLAET